MTTVHVASVGMSVALSGLFDHPDREAVCRMYDAAVRGLARHGRGRERTIYGTPGTCVTASLTGTAEIIVSPHVQITGALYLSLFP